MSPFGGKETRHASIARKAARACAIAKERIANPSASQFDIGNGTGAGSAPEQQARLLEGEAHAVGGGQSPGSALPRKQPIRICGQPYTALLQAQLGCRKVLELVSFAKAWDCIISGRINPVAELGVFSDPNSRICRPNTNFSSGSIRRPNQTDYSEYDRPLPSIICMSQTA